MHAAGESNEAWGLGARRDVGAGFMRCRRTRQQTTASLVCCQRKTCPHAQQGEMPLCARWPALPRHSIGLRQVVGRKRSPSTFFLSFTLGLSLIHI